MRAPTRAREPRHFAGFRCLGAECEDTCCDGWAVTIDRPTFEKYKQCPDPAWRSRFQQLIVIQPAGATEHDYARVQLAGTTCPFLTEGLCSIHKELGEGYLSVTCASFPRVWNAVDEVLEKSLDLGCPEAARVALLDPEPMAPVEVTLEPQDFSLARMAAVDTSRAGSAGKPYRHFGAVRTFVLWILQNRALPLWQRLVILGFFCDKVQEMALGAQEPQIPEVVQAYEQAVSGGQFEHVVNQLAPQPAVRLETVLELIVARITSDFTNRRFLQLYQRFKDGIEWGPDSTMEQISARLLEADARILEPFLARHGHVLEHYLVNYVYRGLFPFGPQESTYQLRSQTMRRSIHSEYMLLAVYYSMIRTLLAGLAAFHQEAFGVEQVIQVVYTFTRTFEHSLAFPERVLQVLAEKGLDGPAGVAVLARS